MKKALLPFLINILLSVAAAFSYNFNESLCFSQVELTNSESGKLVQYNNKTLLSTSDIKVIIYFNGYTTDTTYPNNTSNKYLAFYINKHVYYFQSSFSGYYENASIIISKAVKNKYIFLVNFNNNPGSATNGYDGNNTAVFIYDGRMTFMITFINDFLDMNGIKKGKIDYFESHGKEYFLYHYYSSSEGTSSSELIISDVTKSHNCSIDHYQEYSGLLDLSIKPIFDKNNLPWYRINSDNVRMRDSPGLNTNIVRLLNNDDKIQVIGINMEKTTVEKKEGYWIYVRDAKGYTGWTWCYYID